jgi:uncharacterized membrane protein
MPPFAIAYLGAAAAMLVLDAIWLTLAVPRLYQPQIGHLLAAQPNLGIAAVFYLFYVVGIVVFAVLPAHAGGSWLTALGLGALLGLVAYGTYDFTNMATLRDWPLGITVIDVIWGTFLTATAATAGWFALRLFAAS